MKTIVLAIMLILISGILFQSSYAAVPDWIKNTAKWYGEDKISEKEFLNAIRYLINIRVKI